METRTDTYSGSSNTYDWRAQSFPQQGWECPRCGKINAPWISQCNCPRNNWTISWSAGNTTGNPPPDNPPPDNPPPDNPPPGGGVLGAIRDLPQVLGAVRALPQVLGARRLPQTGQLWWPLPIIVIAGIFFIVKGIKKNAKMKAQNN